MSGDKVNANAFYQEYHGHLVHHLETIESHLRKANEDGLIFLAGDSSLDNKYWIQHASEPACNGYEDILAPPSCIPDVAYWINAQIEEGKQRGDAKTPNMAAINGAVEESSVNQRIGWFSSCCNAHDAFVRDHLRPNDELIVSVGGNDVVLRPSLKTIACMLMLVRASKKAIKAGTAYGMGHFINLFKNRVKQYVELLVSKTKPKRVTISMIYFPCEEGSGWADTSLGALRYDSDPEKLQLVIKEIFARATEQIQIEGVEVNAVAIFNWLDKSDPKDYVSRVEPSVQGGKKMADGYLTSLGFKTA